MIRRTLKREILTSCFKGKTILLIGARQVGKTTLLKEIIREVEVPVAWLNADEADILEEFTHAKTSTQLLQTIGAKNKLIVIDEAQQIPDIGKKLKLLYDTYPEIQVIATGSSAFDLQNQTQDPLTGRKKTFYLYPLSFNELVESSSLREAKRLLDNQIIFGAYPEVVNHPGEEKEALMEIAQSYLYKDILGMGNIRKPMHIEKLLKALAFQVGSEVSYHELAQTVGNIDTATVERYLDLLEKTFVIYKLPSFHRNMRAELKKSKKYYFYDNGIRNVLINNFTSPEMRMDKGALWENYLLSERLKHNQYQKRFVNTYFWRTKDKAEIDYIEEGDNLLNAFEFKWKKQKVRFPASFLNSYPNHNTSVIHRENYESFIAG